MSLDNTPWVIGIVQDTIDRIHDANPHLDFSVLPPPSGPVVVAIKHLFQRQDDCDITSGGSNNNNSNNNNNGNNNNNSKSNGNGVMIGAIVGSVVGVLLLAGLGFFLYRRRVKKREAALKAAPPPPPMAQQQHMQESHPKFGPQSIPPNQSNNYANTPSYTAPPSTVPPSSVGGDHPSWYNPATAPIANPPWANPQHPYPNQSPTPTPGTDSTNYYAVPAVSPNVPPAGVPYPGPHPWANPQQGYFTPPAPSSSGSQSPAPMMPPHLNEKSQYSGYSTSTGGPSAGGSSGAAHVPAWSPDVKNQSGPASSPPEDPMPPPAYSGNN